MCATIRKPEQVIIKTIFLIPHTFITRTIHSGSNKAEMFYKFKNHFLIVRVLRSQFNSDLQHVLTEQRHPRGTIRLFQVPTCWQWCASVENTNIIETQESSFKYIPAKTIFSVHPPCEVQ